MRRQPLRRALAGAAAALALATIATAAARDLFDDIYARSHALESSIRTVTATFHETSTSSLLSVPITSDGTLAVERPDRIVMRYTNPAGRVLLIDGDDLTIAWPSRGIRERSNVGPARRRIDKYFVDKSPAELRRSFSIAAQLAPDHANAWEVRMTPTRDQIRQGLTRLTLWIDRASLLMQSMRMEFPGGDTKTLAFEHVVVNGPIDRKVFVVE